MSILRVTGVTREVGTFVILAGIDVSIAMGDRIGLVGPNGSGKTTLMRIAAGIDELGVLLYGHKKNAYWYGSQLSIDETRALAPYQNATGLQVTSAVLAGMVWALENPKAGIVETDEGEGSAFEEPVDDDADRLLPDAVDVIREYDRASASLLQRRLRIGYARAARIIDQLEARGHVGPFDGSNARQVLRRDVGTGSGPMDDLDRDAT